MKINLSTGWNFDLPFSIKKSFQAASEFGFDGVEFVINSEHFFHKSNFVKNLSKEYNIPILSVHCPIIKPFLFKSYSCVDKTLETAKNLKAGLVVIHPFHLKPYPSKDGLELLNYLSQKTKEYPNITITLENFRHSKKKILGSLENLLNISQKYNFNLTLDTTHVGFTDYNLLEAYSILKNNVQNIHFSDWKNNREHLLPGTGTLPLKGLLKELKKDNYDQLLTLELLYLPFVNQKKAKREIKQSIDFIKKYYG